MARGKRGITPLQVGGFGDQFEPLSHEEHREIRHDPVVADYVNRVARHVLESAGSDNYRMKAAGGPQRHRTYVATRGRKGREEEADNSTLLKAANAARRR